MSDLIQLSRIGLNLLRPLYNLAVVGKLNLKIQLSKNLGK